MADLTCDAVRDRLDGYLDDELAADERAVIATHLEACSVCRARYDALIATRDAVRRGSPDAASDLLRMRVHDAVRGEFVDRAEARARRWRLGAIAAAALFVASAGLGLRSARRGDEAATAEILGSHIRSLMPGHLVDVPSSDRHTVKPWFAGRLDFSPTVLDLAADGFPLDGGRLDYLSGRPVAALVYHRGGHVINVYLWPGPDGATEPHVTTHQGYHLFHWAQHGMVWWAVSDLNEEEMRGFVEMLRRRE